MGLLDDLQAEAEKKQALELEHVTELEAQALFYSEHLQPVMRRASEYFAKVIDNLKIVAPEVTARFPLDPTLEQGVDLAQDDYYFNVDNSTDPRQVDIFCSCRLTEPHEFFLADKESVLKHTDLLDSYNFPYHRKNKLDEQHYMCAATFILEGPLKANIRIRAHPADRCIYIDLISIEEQPFKSYKFEASKVDEKLLDRLARMLVREESRLVEVAVCQNVRESLRRQLEQEKRQQEQDLAEAHAFIEARNQQEQEAKLVNRAKRAVAGKTASVLQKLSRK